MKNVRFVSTDEALGTLRMATEAAAIGIWDLDVLSGDMHWSERCKAIFGIPSGTKVGYADFLDLLDPEERDRVDLAVQRALDPGGSGQYDIEYKVTTPGGGVRWIAAKAQGFFQENEGGRRAYRFLGTVLDRTEQRLSQDALIQSERLAATGRLAAAIVHEISNPLEAVQNLVYLAKHSADEAERTALLGSMETELAHIAEIAGSTLRFYRDPAGTHRVDIREIVASVLDLFRSRLTVSSLRVEADLADGAWVVAGPGELRQVIVNLLDNAIDATSRGGRLRIRSRRYADTVGGRKGGVVLSIADTGGGMRPEVLARLSEPLYTTKGSSGTGIGLWLSREILAKYGFSMRVKSRPGVGTVFTLFMPERPFLSDQEPSAMMREAHMIAGRYSA